MLLFSAFATLSALVTFWVHTFLGQRFVVAKLQQASFDPFAKATMMVCWHITTYLLALITLAAGTATFSVVSESMERFLLLATFLLSLPGALVFLLISARAFKSAFSMPQSRLLGSIALFSGLAYLFPVRVPSNQGLAGVTAAFLAAIALIHFVWARGISWPAKSMGDLNELVVGQPALQRFPGKGMTNLVAVTLSLFALAFTFVAAVDQGSKSFTIGLIVIASIFLLRGILGFFEPWLRPQTKAYPYAHWNRVLYSPVALLIGVLGILAVVGGS